jgi:hypothetical protein
MIDITNVLNIYQSLYQICIIISCSNVLFIHTTLFICKDTIEIVYGLFGRLTFRDLSFMIRTFSKNTHIVSLIFKVALEWTLFDQLDLYTTSTRSWTTPMRCIYSINSIICRPHQICTRTYTTSIHARLYMVMYRSCRGWVKVEKGSGWSFRSGRHRKWVKKIKSV